MRQVIGAGPVLVGLRARPTQMRRRPEPIMARGMDVVMVRGADFVADSPSPQPPAPNG